MTIHFHCGCGQKLKAFAELIGKHFDCPVCGTAVVVPETDEAAPTTEKPAAVAAASASAAATKDEQPAAERQPAHTAKVAKQANVPNAKKKGSKSATNGSHKGSALSDDDIALAALGLTDDVNSASDTREIAEADTKIISASDTQELEPTNLGDITPGRNGHRLSGESRLPSDDEILADRERSQRQYQRTYAADPEHEASTADTVRDLYKLVRKMKKSEPAEVAAKQKKARRADGGERFDFAGLASELGGKVIPGIIGVVFVCFAAYWISSSVMSGGRGLPQLGKVSGVVTLDGKPLAGANITFMPSAESDAEADAASRISSSVGMTDEDGRYSLMYVKDVAGAAVGKHQVVINAPKPNGAEALPRQYNTASTLTFEVKPGKNDAPFELMSK